jgi:hypothetical protein
VVRTSRTPNKAKPKSKTAAKASDAAASVMPAGWRELSITIDGPASSWDVSGDGSTITIHPKRASFRLFDRAGKPLPAPGKNCGPALDRDGKRLVASGLRGPCGVN